MIGDTPNMAPIEQLADYVRRREWVRIIAGISAAGWTLYSWWRNGTVIDADSIGALVIIAAGIASRAGVYSASTAGLPAPPLWPTSTPPPDDVAPPA